MATHQAWRSLRLPCDLQGFLRLRCKDRSMIGAVVRALSRGHHPTKSARAKGGRRGKLPKIACHGDKLAQFAPGLSLWICRGVIEGNPTSWSLYSLKSASAILRWLHVIAGIAWIGSSFYFIHLDLSLQAAARPAGRRQGRRVAGSRRRLLPHDEISGGAGADAGQPDLVQMGSLHDLAVGLRAAGARLLPRRRSVS